MSVPALSDEYAPDLRSATTIQLFADNQFGVNTKISTNWNMRAAEDSLTLKPYTAIRANAGDCIEWYAKEPEDNLYKEFRRVLTSDGVPYIDVPGNHDLTTYNNTATFPYTRTRNGFFERMTRSADEWAKSVVNRTKSNSVVSNGQIAVISFSPDWWAYRPNIPSPNYAPQDPYTEAHLQWLDTQLTSLGDVPTWIMSHNLPLGQLAGNPGGAEIYIQPWDRIAAILDAHPNALGWLSGHWHIAANDTRSVKSLSVGTRNIIAINSPSSQGLRSGQTMEQQMLNDCAKSMFITYDEGKVRIRYRNHSNRTWYQPFGGKYLEITP